MSNLETLNLQLSKLSINVLSYNNHRSINALLDYWKNYNVQLNIIDGSNVPFTPCIEVEQYPLHFNYCHMPLSYEDRIKFLVSLPLRKFSLFCATDEIFIPQSVSRIINYLELNSDYTSGNGQCIQLKLKIKTSNVIDRNIYHLMKDIPSLCNSSNTLHNVSTFFDNYVCATIYSVTRSSAWKKSILFAFQHTYSSPYVYERLIEASNIYQGKFYYLDQPTWIRNGINKPEYLTINRNCTLKRWRKSTNYKNEQFAVKQLISKYFDLSCSDDIESFYNKILPATHFLPFKLRMITFMRSSPLVSSILTKVTKNNNLHSISNHSFVSFHDRISCVEANPSLASKFFMSSIL